MTIAGLPVFIDGSVLTELHHTPRAQPRRIYTDGLPGGVFWSLRYVALPLLVGHRVQPRRG